MRPSDNSPGDYSLFFHINNQIQRFRVEKKGVRYVMGGRTFDCLDAVINRYKTEQIVEGHTLGYYIKRVSYCYTRYSCACHFKDVISQLNLSLDMNWWLTVLIICRCLKILTNKHYQT